MPVLAHRFAKFDPERALALMAATGVRNTFMPPTALKMLRQVDQPAERFGVNLRSIGSGGETLGDELAAVGLDVRFQAYEPSEYADTRRPLMRAVHREGIEL